MFSLVIVTVTLLIAVKMLSVIVTHVAFRDQYAWFKADREKQGKTTNYFVFLVLFFSFLNPQGTWHVLQLQDLPERWLKIQFLVGLSITLLYFFVKGET